MNEEHLCPVCSGPTLFVGSHKGILGSRKFFFRHCNLCHFSYVENYRIDYDNIYSEDYYHGFGADPTVDYIYEIQNISKNIRNYEWKGILSIYKDLCPKGGRWLDYGCGLGGLVRFALGENINITGFEEGWAADKCRSLGIPMLYSSDLANHTEEFDFISAIEVLEHIPKPINTFLQIRKLLKPGGILFITTGNARPWRGKLLNWDYTKVPDIHVSFYEPETLAKCMTITGFQPKSLGFLNKGFVDIIKFKVLKALCIKNQSKLIDVLPWSAIAKLIDIRFQISKQPYGVAIAD